MQQNAIHISKTRGVYFMRLIGRIVIFLIVILIYIFAFRRVIKLSKIQVPLKPTFCIKCGVKSTGNFCPNCGNKM